MPAREGATVDPAPPQAARGQLLPLARVSTDDARPPPNLRTRLHLHVPVPPWFCASALTSWLRLRPLFSFAHPDFVLFPPL
jgi:hypothetical protein